MIKGVFTGLALLLAGASSGCMLFSAPESLLEKNESFDTGRRPFDTYFGEVDELRDQVEAMDSDLFPMRQPLTEHMELDVDTTLAKLLDETRKRVSKMRDYGVSLNLELTPEPRVLEDKGKLEQDPKEEGLVAAIQESASRATENFKKYQELLDRAAKLEAARNDLAGRIDRLPANYDKRELIETEIVAAGRVLAKVEKKLLRDTRTIAHFLVGLVQATDTGASDMQAKKCEEAIAVYDKEQEKAAERSKWKNRWKGRPAARPTPRPTGRPAPPPPTRPATGGGDFEM